MNLNKSYEFFNPDQDKSRVHIIGCGSVGSTIAENLARCGVTNMTFYDFDIVEAHNIHNQMFTEEHLGMNKAEATLDICKRINPDIEKGVKLEVEGYKDQMLSGYVFLCVDNIDLRREICEANLKNQFIKAVFDVRTMLTGAQHYAADWSSPKSKENLLNSMQFSHEEAAEETPVSACGVTLGIVTTVRIVCAYAVNNYIKFTKGEGLWKFLQFDGFNGILDVF